MNAMKILGFILQVIGGLWVISAMLVIWLPVIVHLWLPDSWIPSGFPASPIDMLPSWLMWLPMPGINASLIPLVIANTLLAIPGVVFLLAGEKVNKIGKNDD